MAQTQASFGLRAGFEDSMALVGPLIEAKFESWTGEMFMESGSDGDSRRDHLHVELRRPVRDGLLLIGGTRIDRLNTASTSFDSDSLFAGGRVERQFSRAELYTAVRVLRGMTENRTGIDVEAGVLLRLPESRNLPVRSRRGRFDLILSAEHEDLGDSRLDQTTRAGLRIRYTISRSGP